MFESFQDLNWTPSQKDGALHMIGTMADILLKMKNYKDHLEQFLVGTTNELKDLGKLINIMER